MAEGSQSGVLYINLAGVGIVNYSLASHSYKPTGVHTEATAFGYGRDGFWYANGGTAGAKQLFRLLPDKPEFIPERVGVGTHRIEDIATAKDGTMYGIGDGLLFRINKATGEQTDIGPIGFAADGLAFRDNELLTADGTRLMRLDTNTGQATFVSELPWAVRDMAAEPAAPAAIPTLSGWGLIILSCFLVIVGVSQIGRITAPKTT